MGVVAMTDQSDGASWKAAPRRTAAGTFAPGPGLRSVEQRFWEKVRKSEGCWEWIAAKHDAFGYGVLSVGRKPRLAHRLSWEFAHGSPPPKGFQVCHRCDNPPCVRPDHLFLGTARDNSQDMITKGRARMSHSRYGTHNPFWKYTPEQVARVRELYALGWKRRHIAKETGIPATYVSELIHRGRRAHG
jgi:hypothetical protein